MPGLTANVTIFTLEKNDVLTVSAKALRFAPNEALIAEDETIQGCDARHKLWVREGKVFKAIPVETGVSNGTMTEITAGIKAGTEVLEDMIFGEVAEDPMASQNKNPFMPGPRNNNRNQKTGANAAKK